MMFKHSFGNSSRGLEQSSDIDNPKNMSGNEQSSFTANNSKNLVHKNSNSSLKGVTMNNLVEISNMQKAGNLSGS